jgi:hypothetical protein
LRPTVRRPVCLSVRHPSEADDRTAAGLLMWGALSDDRAVLHVTTAQSQRMQLISKIIYNLQFAPYGKQCVTVMETNSIMLFRVTDTAYCESNVDHTNALLRQGHLRLDPLSPG